ncbi:hypothetical protein AAES_33481 [Amazona aestiva]|uniref:Uncharacterized protein n=1 Tax=Amazona aestiva TaxID=12930 RepID=A0A0Q3P9N1_AMAAE|nr:hypothetical protein AAES_33481 [Amazona aestiva]
MGKRHSQSTLRSLHMQCISPEKFLQRNSQTGTGAALQSEALTVLQSKENLQLSGARLSQEVSLLGLEGHVVCYPFSYSPQSALHYEASLGPKTRRYASLLLALTPFDLEKELPQFFLPRAAILAFMKCSWDFVGLLCKKQFDDVKCLLTVEQAKTEE